MVASPSHQPGLGNCHSGTWPLGAPRASLAGERVPLGHCVCACSYQTAPRHADVWGSRLTQGPILDLLRVTDVEAEATGTAVQLTALGALNCGGRRVVSGVSSGGSPGPQQKFC